MLSALSYSAVSSLSKAFNTRNNTLFEKKTHHYIYLLYVTILLILLMQQKRIHNAGLSRPAIKLTLEFAVS